MKDEVIQHKESVIDRRENMMQKLINKLEHLQRMHEHTKVEEKNLKFKEELMNKKTISEADQTTPEFKCDQCGWTTINKKNLTGHRKAAERRSSLLKSTVCDFT